MTADGRAAATERQRRATHRPVCSVALLRRPLTATATTLRPLAAHSLAVAQHLPSTDLLGAGCKVKSVNRFQRDFHHASVRSIGSDRDTTDMNAATRVFCRNALAELVPVLSYGACARVGGGPTRPDIGHIMAECPFPEADRASSRPSRCLRSIQNRHLPTITLH